MCGINGVIGKVPAVPIVLQGLKRLEYRGYDSWSIGTGSLEIRKEIGKIGSIMLSDLKLPETTLAIAHTRWSTHGGVTQKNAHPHLSQDKTIMVVHNGIIENYQELKIELQKQGIVFLSETDTEVIP